MAEGDHPRAVQHGPHESAGRSAEELVERRRRWFEFYTEQGNVTAPLGGGPYTCPCCGHLTLGERGGYDICRECGWEDDGQDDHDSSVVRGGPNGGESLDDARRRYVASGGERGQHEPPAAPA
jgi:hypothetical protein